MFLSFWSWFRLLHFVVQAFLLFMFFCGSGLHAVQVFSFFLGEIFMLFESFCFLGLSFYESFRLFTASGCFGHLLFWSLRFFFGLQVVYVSGLLKSSCCSVFFSSS